MTTGNRPPPQGYQRAFPQWPLLATVTLICLALATVLASTSFLVSGGVIVGICIFIVCFVSTEASLYLLIFSMLLSPEIGMGDLSGGGGGSRGITIRSEDMLLVVMSFAWVVRMAVHKELGLVRETVLNRPIGYYVAICFFSTAMGLLLGFVDGATGFFFVLKYIEYFVVYFMVANNIHAKEQIKRCTAALLITAAIVCFVAIAQIPSGQRVTAPFEGEVGEPNTLGGYLLLIGGVVGGIATQTRNRTQRWTMAGMLVLMCIPFFATLSRGSYLALPFVYFTFVVFERRRRLTMIAAFILVAGMGAAAIPQNVKDRVLYTFNQKYSGGHQRTSIGDVQLDTSTSARIASWRGAVTDVLDSPVWGFGVTGYLFLDSQYPRVLAETGIVGLALFGLLIAAVFREAVALYHQTAVPLFRGLALGLIAGLVGLLVHAIGANTFIIVRIMEPFWLLVGLVVSARKLEAVGDRAQTIEEPAPESPARNE